MYTARLASCLQDTGRWDVEVVTGRLRPGRAQNSVETTVEHGIKVHGIVQNYPYRGLPEALEDKALDRVFADILGSFKPHMVSIQSLTGLSLGFIETSHAASIPVALHLHDGWWSCPSGGQRLHPDGSLCLPVRAERCAECFSSYQHREGPLERGARALAGKLPSYLPPDTLHRAFQVLPETGKGLLQRVNERGARLRAKHSSAQSAAKKEQLEPAIAQRQQRIEQALERIHLALSPSRFLADSLQADGLTFPNLHVEPTGVPRSAAQAPGRQSQDGLHLLFLGTWVAHKGPQVLAHALATMPSSLFQDGQIRATAVGPAPFPAFQKEVIELAQGRLQLRPALLPHEVPAILSEVDVLIVPSLWAENAPLVVLEAFAAGTPVIASRIGGLPELLSGGGGQLFEAGDHQELATILTELATLPGRLRELRAHVRSPRDVSDFAEAIERRYEQVCTGQPVRATGS